jgi:hypothetical protein
MVEWSKFGPGIILWAAIFAAGSYYNNVVVPEREKKEQEYLTTQFSKYQASESRLASSGLSLYSIIDDITISEREIAGIKAHDCLDMMPDICNYANELATYRETK